MKSFSGKNPKVVEIKFEAINGYTLPDEIHWELEYNPVSERYNLRSGADQGGDLVFSHVSLTACKKKAASAGIVWR